MLRLLETYELPLEHSPFPFRIEDPQEGTYSDTLASTPVVCSPLTSVSSDLSVLQGYKLKWAIGAICSFLQILANDCTNPE